ncbi:MAG: RNA methyltransferase [Thioalkalivibrio sp.]
MNLLQQIRIVLIQTSHPGNIGSSARAMKTMGLSQLHLVRPVQYPCAEATAMASGADDLLARTPVHTDLDEALTGCRLVMGTSARQRSLRWPQLSPREAAAQMVEAAGQGPVALLFGREQSGLTNEELDRCQSLITIPASEDYSSLNLAAAVQVLSYELRVAALDAGLETAQVLPIETLAADELPASAEALEGFFTHLERVLISLDFLDPDNPRLLMRRLRRLYGRAVPTVAELNILRGILTAAQKGPRR